MKNVSLLLLSCLIGLAFLSNVSAATASSKFGVVDFQKVMKNSSTATQAQKKLQKQFAPQRASIVEKQKALKEMQSKMKRDSAVMRASDKKELETKMITTRKELSSMVEDFNKKLFKSQQETMRQLVKEIMGIVADIAKKNHLDLVVPKEGVLYASDQIDITAQVEKQVK